MPKAELSEIYFVVFMMFLLIAVSVGSFYFFFRTLRRERRAQAQAKSIKPATKPEAEASKKPSAEETKVA